MIGSVAVLVAVAVTLVIANPFGGDDYPDEWDPRAAPFTRYVERTAGHDYEHPVTVEFLTDAEFVELVSQNPDELSDEDRELYADSEAQGRALGLFSGSTDLFGEQDTLSTAGILAFYSPDDKEVVVRLPEGTEPDDVTSGDDLPVDVRVTLVHELVHVLQDQVYDLGGVQQRAETDEEYAAALGLIEGHAEWVAQQFVVDELSDAEQEEYSTSTMEQGGEYEEATAEVTPVLGAAQSAPYVLGPSFVAALADEGIDAIDDAFRTPPTTERELMQPDVYLDGDDAPELPDLELPDDADELDRSTLGAVTLYFMLSTALDPPDALRTVDATAGDRYLAYTTGDDAVCVDVSVAAADDDGADLLADGFERWVAARPDGTEATTTRDGDRVDVHVCDPGEDVEQDVPGEPAIAQVFARAGDLGYFLLNGYDVDEATCLTDGLYYELTLDELLDAATQSVDEVIDGAFAACGG